jgi:GNAT superfamily N-acetyltransferase
VGRALVQAAARRAVEAGRSELGGMDETPVRPGFEDAAAPFARHFGFADTQHMVRRELVVPLSASQVDALQCHPKATAPGYAMLTFADRWPDEFIDDRCELGRRMSTDVPMGEQQLDEERWDEERVRQIEANFVAQDRAKISTAALHGASGRLVAYTEVAIPRGAPESAWQHDTLVMHEHRGHGLGFAMKVVNTLAVQSAHPGVRRISTWNAAENQPMIAVNDEMGHVVAANSVYWLKKLDGLSA